MMNVECLVRPDGTWALVPKHLTGVPTTDSAIRKLVRSFMTNDGPRAIRQPAHDTMHAPPTESELEENQRRTAAMSGVDLGMLWLGDIVRKTPAGSIKDRRVLDEAIATAVTGLRGYFGGELGKSTAEAGPAGALAFTAPSADPEGARSDVPENIRRGAQMTRELEQLWGKPRSNELPTDEARDSENRGEPPQEAGIVIGDPRHTVADGTLHDLLRNRSIGDTINAQNRVRNNQPALLHGQ